MAIKLHRCPNVWVKLQGHPCWKVQSALGTSKGSSTKSSRGPLRRSKRDEVQRLSAQQLYPVIEFEDGSVYRAESKEMAETIRSGKLDEKRGDARP